MSNIDNAGVSGPRDQPTPRTNAALDKEVGTPDSMAVASLCRTLERECQSLRAQLDAMEQAISLAITQLNIPHRYEMGAATATLEAAHRALAQLR